MKMLSKYKELKLISNDDVFGYLISNFRETIKTYNFFVAWQKVVGNISQVEISLNILNSLIGKNDIENCLRDLIKSYPEIVTVIPLLIAVRDTTIQIVDINGKDINYSFVPQKSYSDTEIDELIVFCKLCGLLEMLSHRRIKNLVDYCIGVEVGLDTNARKNRSGQEMETLTEIYVKALCEKNGYKYLKQATVAKINQEFGKYVPTDKSERRFDFAINTDSKVYILEANYYGGGGSKLKSVAGEFKSLHNLITKATDVEFIWVTDGRGWNTALKPLRETFNAIDYVLNLKLVEDGAISEIITHG